MLLVLLFLVGGVMITSGVRFLLLPAEIRTFKRKDDPVAAAQAGRRAAARLHRSRPTPTRMYAYEVKDRLPRWATLDAAVALERLASRTTRIEVDVERTVEAFAREPTQLRIHTQRRIAAAPVSLWLDVEGGDHPQLQFARTFVDDLRRLGVAVDLQEFNYAPLHLRLRGRARLGPPERIEGPAYRDGSRALVVMSRGLFSRPRDRDVLARHIDAFPAVVWFNLLFDRPSESVVDYLGRLRVREVPLTIAGLRHFRSEAPRALPRPRRVDDETATPALACWALCAALVGNPTWSHLETFRSSPLLPEISGVLRHPSDIQRLCAWLERHCSSSCQRADGRGLAIPPPFAEHLIRRFREHQTAGKTSDMEVRARRLILGQLADQGEDDEWTKALRTVLRARHAFALAPDRHWNHVTTLFKGIMGDDMRKSVSDEIARWDVPRLDGRLVKPKQRRRQQRTVDLFGVEQRAQVPVRELMSGLPPVWRRTAVAALIIEAALMLLFWGRWVLR